MSATRPFDLLIFDWDGTLSDSAQSIVDSMQAAIVGLQLAPRSDAQIRELIGLGLADGMARLYPEMDQAALLKLLAQYRSHWLSQQGGGVNEPPLYPGVLAMLQAAADAGYTLTIATGKSRPGLDRSLAHHKAVRSLMTATRTADETANKPHPRMVLELLAETGIPASRALVIGDTEYDAAMAAAAGVAMVGVACGVHNAARIARAGAKAVLPDAAALWHWLATER